MACSVGNLKCVCTYVNIGSRGSVVPHDNIFHFLCCQPVPPTEIRAKSSNKPRSTLFAGRSHHNVWGSFQLILTLRFELDLRKDIELRGDNAVAPRPRSARNRGSRRGLPPSASSRRRCRRLVSTIIQIRGENTKVKWQQPAGCPCGVRNIAFGRPIGSSWAAKLSSRVYCKERTCGRSL